MTWMLDLTSGSVIYWAINFCLVFTATEDWEDGEGYY